MQGDVETINVCPLRMMLFLFCCVTQFLIRPLPTDPTSVRTTRQALPRSFERMACLGEQLAAIGYGPHVGLVDGWVSEHPAMKDLSDAEVAVQAERQHVAR